MHMYNVSIEQKSSDETLVKKEKINSFMLSA